MLNTGFEFKEKSLPTFNWVPSPCTTLQVILSVKMDEDGQSNIGVSTEKADTVEIFWGSFGTSIMGYDEQKYVLNALKDDRRGQCLAVDDPHVSKAEFEMSHPLSPPDQKADVRSRYILRQEG
jgi:hypothetical protein